MKRGIFCHTQFKKMLLSVVMIQFVIALSDIMDRIIAAQLLGDDAMAGINFVDPFIILSEFFGLMVAIGTSYTYSCACLIMLIFRIWQHDFERIFPGNVRRQIFSNFIAHI